MRIIVLGQGVAGTLVSWRLRQRGIDHTVVDRGHQRAASRAAAGIVNPVTGRRFVLTWRAAEVVAGLEVYRALEAALDVTILHPLEILRDLSTPEALNQWDLRRTDPGYAPHLSAPSLRIVPGRSEPLRVGPTKGYRVDLPQLLVAFRQNLRERDQLIEADVEFESSSSNLGASLVRGGLGWRLAPSRNGEPLTAESIIDCRGAASMDDGWRHLAWRGTKGEALRLRGPHLPRHTAVKRRLFLSPTGSRDQVWVGGTNTDHFEDDAPSAAGYERLAAQAAEFGLRLPPDTEHLAAIRPTTRHRRPFVEPHPEYSGLWICGGLGTKGAGLAPLCSQQVVEALRL